MCSNNLSTQFSLDLCSNNIAVLSDDKSSFPVRTPIPDFLLYLSNLHKKKEKKKKFYMHNSCKLIFITIKNEINVNN